MLTLCKQFIYLIWRLFCEHLPIDGKKVVFWNFKGNGFGDNPKAIAQALHNIDPSVKMIWISSKVNRSTPDWLPEVTNGFRKIFEIATSRIWIDNCRKTCETKKRKGQYYIQTWHGMIALKRIEKDVEDHLDASYIQSAKYDSSIADVFISNSRFTTEMYNRAFWYNGLILETGSPRCDILFNNVKTYRIHDLYKIPYKTKLLLYAPTFRKDFNDAYNLDFESVRKAFESRFDCKVAVLVRMHPNIQERSILYKKQSGIIDATDYPDMYELLSECDFLISDYSSTIFEFGLVHKPVFLYANDIEEYKSDRGFYFRIETLPFPLAENNDELVDNIQQFDQDEYHKELMKFYSDLGIKETGDASIEVAKHILSVINT